MSLTKNPTLRDMLQRYGVDPEQILDQEIGTDVRGAEIFVPVSTRDEADIRLTLRRAK